MLTTTRRGVEVMDYSYALMDLDDRVRTLGASGRLAGRLATTVHLHAD
jgi:hypothetical protein